MTAAALPAVQPFADRPPVSIDTFPVGPRIVFGTALAAFLVFGIGGWAAVADLSGAIMAPGSVVVDRHSKKLQHKDGGIVAAINVRPGDKVEAGVTLIRLDDTQTRAEIGIIRTQMIELTGRKARLAAERDGLTAIDFPAGFDELGPESADVRSGEIRLFNENAKSRQSQREQLRSRIGQLGEEITGLTRQRDAKKTEFDIIKKEFDQLLKLFEKNLIPVTRVYAMERESTRLNGEHGALIANIARVKGQTSELEMQILAIDQNVRSETQKELRAIEGRLGELAERYNAAADRLTRMELKAPQAGIVHELSVHTVGGVISPAEQVLLIVPENEALTVEARFSPTDIDQLTFGQPARLRFSAFNQRTTPEVHGHVQHISADVTLDPKTGQSYYTGRIELDAEARRTLGQLKLVPGMPVEIFVATAERTAITYFIKPFTDQFARAFKED